MPLEDVESPPYPNAGTTAQSLYNYLKQLRKWVVYYRDDMNTALGQEVICDVIDIPNKAGYLSQPVCVQYQHLMIMRHLREQWDQVIRDFENDWTCRSCLRARSMLVQAASVLINGAFTTYEVREARQQKDAEMMQRSFERLVAIFSKLMEPEGKEELNKDEDE